MNGPLDNVIQNRGRRGNAQRLRSRLVLAVLARDVRAPQAGAFRNALRDLRAQNAAQRAIRVRPDPEA